MEINNLDIELERKIMSHREINKSAIARKYGIDRHTVSRHLNKIEGTIKKRKRRDCKIIEYENEIIDMLLDGCTIKSIYMFLLNLTAIEDLKTYSNFKQYVRRWYSEYFVEGKHLTPRYRYETPPGEQLQFDWVSPLSLHLKDGTLLTFNLWNATLGFSRKHFYKVTETIAEKDVRNCLIECIIYFGGIPKKLLTDNMSAIVAIRGNSKYVHSTFRQFVKDIGSQLQLCKCRHSYTKGKVESANKYQNWIKPYDYKFENKGALFATIQDILNQSNYQINTTTGLPPDYLFKAKEKGTLLPLPSVFLLNSYLNFNEEKTVNISSLIYYKRAWYGVPHEYINKKVLVKEENNLVFVFSLKLKLIATYDLKDEGIHYAKSLYNIAKGFNETLDEFNNRIDSNLRQLSKYQEKI